MARSKENKVNGQQHLQRSEYMNKKICYIVGAGENYGLDFIPSKEDFVIAADAGLRYLEEKGIFANLTVGDFDTLQYIPQGENVLRLPPERTIRICPLP